MAMFFTDTDGEQQAQEQEPLTGLDPETIHLLKTAGLFDVHRWSDYPEVNAVVTFVYHQIAKLRKSRRERIREANKVQKHLKVVILDLFAAHKLGLNSYRGISLHKPDYQKKSRYRKIYLTYDYLVGVINDLAELSYIEQHKGFFDRTGGKSKRTRIKATDKLLDLILSEDFKVKPLIEKVGAVKVLTRHPDDEAIILHGPDGELLDYIDSHETNRMRQILVDINARLNKATIVLDITDDQQQELAEIYKQQERLPIDFTKTSLHRVFNDQGFKRGGRFYGGWWQSLPSRFRKYIRINHKPTVELDYSGHHIRILYAREGIKAAEDLYAVDNCPFTRKQLKRAALIVVNARNRTSALRALNVKKLGIDTKALLGLIETHFAPISKYFYSDAGLELQYVDSMICERIMLRMMDKGAVVLPIHDSFIVRNSYEDELWRVMHEEYQRQFGSTTFLKRDQTVLDKPDIEGAETQDLKFVSDDLDELLDFKSRSWVKDTFGTQSGGVGPALFITGPSN